MSRIHQALKRAHGAAGAIVDREPLTPAAAFDQYAPEVQAVEAPPPALLARVAAVDQYAPEVQIAGVPPPSPPMLPTPADTDVPRVAVDEDPEFEGKLVTSRSMKSLAIQQYRRLAAALYEMQIERGCKTIMVTSAVPTEGKSFTLTNLGLTLGDCYRRQVILIDADLRHPTLHEAFGLQNTGGLSDGLRSDGGQISPVRLSPYLTVLPAGRPDPNPLASLTSDRMRSLIEEAASSYEWVLIDTPPISLLPDAHHLARLVDGVVVVIAARATPYALLERTLGELGRDKILGIVLNRAADDTIAGARYHGSY